MSAILAIEPTQNFIQIGFERAHSSRQGHVLLKPKDFN